MGKPVLYSKVKVIKISETQDLTLKNLRKYNVNVARFIRQAIQEKLEREKIQIVSNYKTSLDICPF
jgi:post-segregation antitoxin (ccd killing protein)